jgi:hypothetical protein
MSTPVDLEAIASELSGLFAMGNERAPLTDTNPEWTSQRPTASVPASGDGGKRAATPGLGARSDSPTTTCGTLTLAGLPQPKIEPEIVFGLGAAPLAGMDERELLDCVDWIALGFELVSSIYPDWNSGPPTPSLPSACPRHSSPASVWR